MADNTSLLIPDNFKIGLYLRLHSRDLKRPISETLCGMDALTLL